MNDSKLMDEIGRVMHETLEPLRRYALDVINNQRVMFKLDPANVGDSGTRFDVQEQQVNNQLRNLELNLVGAVKRLIERGILIPRDQVDAAVAAAYAAAAQHFAYREADGRLRCWCGDYMDSGRPSMESWSEHIRSLAKERS